MQVVASDEALSFIRDHGGRLFVWTQRRPCCGPTLEASTDPPRHGAAFRPFEHTEEFELMLPPTLRQLPHELEVQMRGKFHRRVVAYWDGCSLPI